LKFYNYFRFEFILSFVIEIAYVNTYMMSASLSCLSKYAYLLMVFIFETRSGAEVPEVNWCEPGESAAMEVLMGSTNGFLTKRLRSYSTDRNNPCKPTALSGLSPYLHFGQISAQRCALEARKLRNSYPQVWLFYLICRFCGLFFTGRKWDKISYAGLNLLYSSMVM
jgi:deoxyribodipyrimidine photolyase